MFARFLRAFQYVPPVPQLFDRFCIRNCREDIVREVQRRIEGHLNVMLDFAREHTKDPLIQRQTYHTLCVTLDVLHNVTKTKQVPLRPMLAIKYSSLNSNPDYLEKLVRRARHKGTVDITIDAEQSFLQPTIHKRVVELQRENHSRSSAMPFRIYNTYQAYMKDSFHQLRDDLDAYHKDGVPFACKLVRGAYLAEERKTPARVCFFDNKNETDMNYRKCLDLLLQHPSRPQVIAATHNAADISYIQSIYKSGEANNTIQLAFLKGMNESTVVSITRTLDHPPIYMYTPFGSIDDVVPYLVRRLHEQWRSRFI